MKEEEEIHIYAVYMYQNRNAGLHSYFISLRYYYNSNYA